MITYYLDLSSVIVTTLRPVSRLKGERVLFLGRESFAADLLAVSKAARTIITQGRDVLA